MAEHIFHLALRRDWEEARSLGEYRVSTLGRALAEEGFVHTSFAHQVDGVRAAFYADVAEPVVLLEIDPAMLGSPVVVEVPDEGAEAFPHVYGPIPVSCVVAVRPA